MSTCRLPSGYLCTTSTSMNNLDVGGRSITVSSDLRRLMDQTYEQRTQREKPPDPRKKDT